MLDAQTFKTVVASTPLVSADLIVQNEGKVLLGKRKNRPAQGYYFTPGGRVRKNEKISDALMRIAKEELNLTLEQTPTCIGVFEHLYDDSIFPDVSTHYVNLGFALEIETLPELPHEQHSSYRWFETNDLLTSEMVHPNVKLFFTGNGFCIAENNKIKREEKN